MSNEIFGIESPKDVRCEFEFNGIVYSRWIGNGAGLPRSEILKIAMLSSSICPTNINKLSRIVIKQRKEFEKWKQPNRKPAW